MNYLEGENVQVTHHIMAQKLDSAFKHPTQQAIHGSACLETLSVDVRWVPAIDVQYGDYSGEKVGGDIIARNYVPACGCLVDTQVSVGRGVELGKVL